MKGSRRWRRRVRRNSERYWRVYGYATEEALRHWRFMMKKRAALPGGT